MEKTRVSKIYTVSFIFFVSWFCCSAQMKTYQKMLEKYDVIGWSDSLHSDDNADFWRALRENSREYQEILDAAQRGKCKNIQEAIGEAVVAMKQNRCNTYMGDANCFTILMDSLKEWSGINSVVKNSNLFISLDFDENAYTFPGGDVYFTLGILKLIGADYEALAGIYAHELAHLVLQHSFSNLYYAHKRLKKNKLIGDVLGAITLTAATVAEIQNANPYSNGELIGAAADMWQMGQAVAAKDAEKYYFKYGLEQEYEADIIAYRFLEWTGIGGETWIRALESLDSDLEIFQNPETDHPLTSKRIGLLRYMGSEQYQKDRTEMIKRKENKDRFSKSKDDLYD